MFCFFNFLLEGFVKAFPVGLTDSYNLGTIFKGMNARKDLNTVLKDRSSRNERERENDWLKKAHGAMSIVMNIVKQLSINVKLQVQHLSRPDSIAYSKSLL